MRFLTIFALAFVLSVGTAQAQAPLWPAVAEIFAARCVKCHSGDFPPMGLSLADHASVLSGSWTGPVVAPGEPVGSAIMDRVTGRATPRMPLDGPPFLSEDEISAIAAWIAAGAPEDGAAPPPPAPEPVPEGPPTFAQVEPILQRRCIVCHSDNSRLAAPPEGLRLTSLANVVAGGDRIVVVPGNPAASELWRRVIGLSEPRMPFDGPPWLSEDQIALIEAWIAAGAPDADGRPSPVPVGGAVRLRGRMTGPLEIDGAAFAIDAGTRVEEWPAVGAEAEVRAVVTPEGGLRAIRLRAR